jgi:hypothetical protein
MSNAKVQSSNEIQSSNGNFQKDQFLTLKLFDIPLAFGF